MPALVPGDTHSALLAAGKIPDPYVGMNELSVQWVGREDWSYERSFQVDVAFLLEDQVFLSCDSLDTVAEVFLNGKKIGSSDNMFTRLCFDAKPFLRSGANTIRVSFASSERTATERAARLPYPVPHVRNPVQSPNRNLVRKVQCHSGWDWGPCLMVAGIAGEISLGAFSDVRIDYVATEQKHGKGKCTVRVFAECTAAREGPYTLEVALGEKRASRKVMLSRGSNSPSLDITLENPGLVVAQRLRAAIPLRAVGPPGRRFRLEAHRPSEHPTHQPGGRPGALHDFPRERPGHLLQGRKLDPPRRPAPA